MQQEFSSPVPRHTGPYAGTKNQAAVDRLIGGIVAVGYQPFIQIDLELEGRTGFYSV